MSHPRAARPRAYTRESDGQVVVRIHAGGKWVEIGYFQLDDLIEQLIELDGTVATPVTQVCRVCGCTDDDCRGCIERTGEACHWVEPDLCSACVEAPPA
jgi:hypothetical protein